MALIFNVSLKLKKFTTMKNSLLAVLILFSSFAFGQEESAETPKIAVKVPKGETVILKGVSIKFLDVVEDSRCPTGVTCIWAGRAIVKVEVTSNGTKEEKMLTFGEVRPGEEKNTNIYSSSKFSINGLTLNPYPTSESTGKDKGYVLLICEEKNE
ncbi:hypothetical protein AEQU1_00586 [Aequorivita sp. CIP111184]|nr:hypothetical protein AEQU1_00586 [Aequorivita sp. CIP111184]